ncbi:MAG: iron chelate uptake ABC transporter family permease subunit, partial [Lachnospiraceae bacterium]
MQKNRKYRYIIAFIFLAIGVVTFLTLNICIGSVSIALPDILETMTGHESDETMARILWDIRLPRTLAVIILGGALSLAGYLLQTFFHNPIAGPFVLGISSGAKMVVALVMVFFMERAIRISSADMILAAFVGAILSMGFVLLLSRRVKGMSMLVVSG